MKFIRVTMPDLSKWDVPAKIIAENRAKYYANLEPPSQETYETEYEYTMNDKAELVDWAHNNMNWDEVEKFAKQANVEIPVDFQEGWVNGDMEVVEVD